MTTNAPYRIEFYSVALAEDSDPDPSFELDVTRPYMIFSETETRMRADFNVSDESPVDFVYEPDESTDPMTDVYRVYRDGHESSYGVLVGTMFVMSAS